MTERFDDYCPAPSSADALLGERGLAKMTSFELWALVGVSGRVVLRKSWRDELEVAEHDFVALRASTVPEPDLDATAPKNHRALIGDPAAPKPGRCSSCWLDAGHQQCVPCAGRGQIQLGDSSETCPSCEGRRKTRCSTCRGTGRTHKVELQYGEDRATDFAHVFVPEVPPALTTPLVEFVRTRASVPECFALELGEEHARADAYRGRRSGEEFRGYRLGNAVVRARVYVERVRRAPSIVAERHSARVWPFALLALESGIPAALALDESQRPQLIVPSSPL